MTTFLKIPFVLTTPDTQNTTTSNPITVHHKKATKSLCFLILFWRIFIILISFFSVLQLPTVAIATEKQLPASQKHILLSFSPIVKAVSPAVVNIYTKRKVHVTHPFLSDPMFRYFFGDNVNNGTEKIERSLGSGVLVKENGLIITSSHVIKGSDEVTVILSDKREFSAKIILIDEKTDLALLKIDAGEETFTFIPLMDSDTLEVGDLVLAIGNPFGVGQTVTSGIVSALARTTLGITDYQFFIQTDAAINPGNSGGALVNMQGKLAGINSAIFSRSGGSNGIGFAIPANMVATVINNFANKRVVRPWLGAVMQNVTHEIAESLNMKHPKGALLTKLFSLGAAQKSGLKIGDVILAVDGVPIEDTHSLRFRIATYPLESHADFTILRQGQHKNIQVQMLPAPEQPKRDIRILEGNHPLAGIRVANLSPALIDELTLNILDKGVVILDLSPEGIAGRIGFKVYDIIKKINDIDIISTKQLERIINNQTSTGYKVLLQRQDKNIMIEITR